MAGQNRSGRCGQASRVRVAVIDLIDTFTILCQSGQLVGKQRQIMNQLIVFPGTSGEVVRAMVANRAIIEVGSMGDWRSRFNELQSRGLIREVGQRRCKISNRTCIVWAPTGREKPLARHKGHGTSPLSKWKELATHLADDLTARVGASSKCRSLAEYHRMAK